MVEKHVCPAEKCSYEGNLQAVAGHYGGKPDEAHQGNYSDAVSMLAEGGSTPSNQGGGESQEGGSDGNPLKQGPEAAEGSGHADEDEPACPVCGTPAGMSRDDLEDGAHYECTNCEQTLKWESE